MDHGIEPAEERVKAGKPAEGVVRLRAFHQSGSVVIEVIDDGAGISTERVLAKAIERGLVTPEQAEAMTQREALQTIFVAGFHYREEGDQRIRARHGDGCGARQCGGGGRKRGVGIAHGVGNDCADAGAADPGDRARAGGAERRAELRGAAKFAGRAGVCAASRGGAGGGTDGRGAALPDARRLAAAGVAGPSARTGTRARAQRQPISILP